MSVGSRIRQLRKAKGITARCLAEMVGVHQQHIFALERGRFSPSLRTLQRIAEALGVTVADLFEDTGSLLCEPRGPVAPVEPPEPEQGRESLMTEVVRRLVDCGVHPDDVMALGLIVARALQRQRAASKHTPDK